VRSDWRKLAEPATGFGARLQKAFDTFGQLCVGIDPHSYLLSEWGLPDSAAGVREFGLRVVDASAGRVALVKPQVAFYERHGSAGFAALEEVLAAARAAGLLIVADAKRGDLGTSVEAYGQAWLTPGSPLEADAVTISAYLGLGSIEMPMALAEETGKGVFVLAATSNPESTDLQSAILSRGSRVGQTVASSIVTGVGDWNATRGSAGGEQHVRAALEHRVGNIGVVLGATVDFDLLGIQLDAMSAQPATPILAPGFGHQGARFGDLGALYGAAAPFAVVAASRSILGAGPSGLVEAITAQAAEVFACRA
jgi:orotidine-5'-phosphate decarboxylase